MAWLKPPESGHKSEVRTSISFEAFDRLRELEEKVTIAKQALDMAVRALDEVKAEMEE